MAVALVDTESESNQNSVALNDAEMYCVKCFIVCAERYNKLYADIYEFKSELFNITKRQNWKNKAIQTHNSIKLDE